MARVRKRRRSCQTTDPQVRADREGAEETYRLLFDRNPAPMFVFDESTLEILAANDAMVRDSGWTREELLSMSVREIHPPEGMAELLAVLDRNRRPDAVFSRECRHVRKDGSLLDVDSTIGRISFGGRSARLAVVTDATERHRAEEALRDSEERFRAFMNHAPNIAWMKDEEGRHVYLNRTYERRFGVRSEECRGKTDFELWPREVAEEFRRNDEAVLTSGRVVEVVEEAPDPDGNLRSWWSFKFPVQDSSGARYVGGIGLDVTDRNRAEVALRDSERRLRFALEAARLGSWDFDLVRHTAYRSLRHDKIFGYEKLAPEWSYEILLEHVLPEDRSAVDGKVERAIRTGRPWVFECRIRRRDGAVRWIWVKGEAMRDAGGQAVRYRGIVQDITEGKEAQERLRMSEERLRLALEGSRMGAWEWVPGSSQAAWSKGMYRLFGLPKRREPMEVARFMKLVHPEDREEVESMLRRALGRSAGFRFESRIIRPDGEVRWLAGRGRGFRKAGLKPARLLGVNYDITERKRLESEFRELNANLERRVGERTAELREANETLRREAERRRVLEARVLDVSEREKRRIGEDLHDGLCQVTAAAAMMSEGLARDLEQKSLPLEAAAARRAAELIASIGEEARRLSHGLAPVRLSEDGLQNALQDLALYTTHVLGVPCELRSDVPVRVADPSVGIHLFRIAQEAVNNAVHHAGPSRIGISLCRDDTGIVLSIADDGCGLPPDPPDGEGIGLHVMRHRAETMGGTLRFERGPEGGTTVACFLPASAVMEPEKGQMDLPLAPI